MLVALGFHSGDIAQTRELLRWCKDLGGCPEHNLLLVADAGIQWSIGLEMIALGNKAFRNTGLITTKESVQGWPQGGNMLWKTAAQHCKEHHTAFLWLEPDAIPLKPDWLNLIHEAYTKRNQSKPFMGRIYADSGPGFTKRMSGIAVYPEHAIDLIGHFADGDKAWDMASWETVVPMAENTKLIQHFWGPDRMLAPTFSEVRTKESPINTFTLDMIDPGAAIFHRVKENSLIRLLRKKMAIPEVASAVDVKFDVVLPFCATDAELALANVKWMAELNSYDRTMILAIDDQCRLVGEVLNVAQSAFEQVIIFKYPLPPVPGHPQAANWAFKHVAKYMQERGRPWLWNEADMFALKPEWLDVLQSEYDACGKPCMGPVVADMNHANGTCIYCADLAKRCPRFMEHPEGHWAFDMVIKDELMPMLHDASHLMQHAWCMVNGQMLPYGYGELPEFRGPNSLHQLWPNAVTFHRIKNTTLIDRLREQAATRR